MEDLGSPSSLMSRNNDGYGPYRGKVALVATAVLTGLSGFIVLMRLCTRATLVHYVGREDLMVVAAMAFSLVYLAMVVADVENGLGYHHSTLPRQESQDQLKYLWLALPFYNVSLNLTKLSILLQYLRIFPNRMFRRFCYTIMGVLVIFCIWVILSGFLTCVPVARFWDPSISGYCMNLEGVWLFNSFMHMVTELSLLILPMPLVAHLQLPKPQKIGLIVMFSMGGLVFAISASRIYSIHFLARDKDMSWYGVSALSWTAAECNTAIICACLPPLRPLVHHIFPRIRSIESADHYGEQKSSNRHSKYKSGRVAAFAATEMRFSHDRNPDVEEIYLPQRRFYDFDYDTVLAKVKSGDSRGENQFGRIEVTTEVTTEVHNAESSQERSSQSGNGSKSEETDSERMLIMR